MAEWFKALVLKTKVLKNTVGSNPTLSLYFLDYSQTARHSFLIRTFTGSIPVNPTNTRQTANLLKKHAYSKTNFGCGPTPNFHPMLLSFENADPTTALQKHIQFKNIYFCKRYN